MQRRHSRCEVWQKCHFSEVTWRHMPNIRSWKERRMHSLWSGWCGPRVQRMRTVLCSHWCNSPESNVFHCFFFLVYCNSFWIFNDPKHRKMRYKKSASVDVSHYAYLCDIKAGYRMISEIELDSWKYTDEKGNSFHPFQGINAPHTHSRLMLIDLWEKKFAKAKKEACAST